MITTVKNKLYLYQDLKYRDFSSKLLPKNTKIIGVRLPILRKLSREIKISELSDEYLEELLLHAFIIGNIKDIDKVFLETSKFLPLINNWSVCDSFVASLKITKKYPDLMFNYLLKQVDSNLEYVRRFVIVMFLWYYIDYKYIDRIYEVIINIKSDEYYVKMAIAWLITEVFYFDKEYGEKFIRSIDDIFIYKKTLSKIKESNKYRKNFKEV